MQSIPKWSITNRVSLIFVILVLLLTAKLEAQEVSGKIERGVQPAAVQEKPEEKQPSKPQTTVAAKESEIVNPNASPKRVGSAVINLQTTVTGNQEQPRVMYILPWQSPAPEDVDFESLENQTKSVFGHIERDELRRELESLEKKAK